MTDGRSARLERWLLDPSRPIPAVPRLRRVGLAAYAYTVLPPHHPERRALRGDYLALLARHRRVRSEMVPLLRAWSEAGIEALLFKGFHLSEFVYPVPGARFHGDVDVLVRPGRTAEAIRIAAGLGWVVAGDEAAVRMSQVHCAGELLAPGGNTCVDLHRWAVHCSLPWSRVQRRITEAVWAASRLRVWEGVRVREMNEVDALLVGVVLQRCWGADSWRLKPHDALDFRLLARDVPRDRLLARARALGCARTLRRFLERCDPPLGRLRLAHPSGLRRLAWNLMALPERGLLGAPERVVARLLRIPSMAPGVLTGLRWVLHARRALRRHPEPAAVLAALSPLPTSATSLSAWRRFRTIRGIYWTTRLLRTGRQGGCLVHALAIYAALRRQGWPVRFVSGVRREGGRVVGHAWVEIDGRVLWELGEPMNRQLYAVNFAHPPDDADPGAAPADSERGGGVAEPQPAGVYPIQQGGEEALQPRA